MSMSYYSTYVYTPNYLEEVWGIPTHGYGYISSLCVLGLVGPILWSRLAERYSCHKLILLICTIIYALLFASMWLEFGVEESQLTRMWIVAFLYGGSSAFANSMAPLLDQIVLDSLSVSPLGEAGITKGLFGRQRLWGSLGHAVIVALNGWGIQNKGYSIMFLSLILSSIIFVGIMLFYPIKQDIAPLPKSSTFILENQTSHQSEEEKERQQQQQQLVVKPQSSSTFIIALLSNVKFLLFIIGILIAGYVRCVVGVFAPVYFKKVLKMRDATYGIAMQMRLVPELLFFYYGKWFSANYGHETIMYLAQMAGILRAAIYGFVPSGQQFSWVTYPAEMLKGINSAGIFMSGPLLAQELAPIGCETTALAVFHGVYGSLAMILGGIVGGQILQHFNDGNPDTTIHGFSVLFRGTTLAGLIPLVLLISLRGIKGRVGKGK